MYHISYSIYHIAYSISMYKNTDHYDVMMFHSGSVQV